MKKNVLLIAAVSLLAMSILMTGCHREAAPDVTPTPAAGAQAATTPEEVPGATLTAAEYTGTAVANATMMAAEPAEEAVPTEMPTTMPEPLPTETPIPPTPEPPTPEPPAPEPATTTASTGQVTYVVQPGDNLFRLALRYGTTVEAIASANSIANPNQIRVGQVLTIPTSGVQPTPQPGGETTYVVQPGDNLFRIALRYGLSYTTLAQYNSIPNPALIRVGQVLRIPPR